MFRRGVARALMPVVVAVFVGCGGADGDVVAETHRSTEGRASQTNEADSSLPTETMTTSSTAPPPARPTSCGTTAGPDDAEVAVTITTGWGNCVDAVALVDIYFRDRPSAAEDATRALDIDGWQCASDTTAEPGEVVVCELPNHAVVTAATVP